MDTSRSTFVRQRHPAKDPPVGSAAAAAEWVHKHEVFAAFALLELLQQTFLARFYSSPMDVDRVNRHGCWCGKHKQDRGSHLGLLEAVFVVE